MASPSESAPLREFNQSPPLPRPPPLPNLPKNPTPQNPASLSESNTCKCKASAGLGTPERLKLPKPFKYPERYTSPTDHMISPISKGLLARSRRGAALLPPSIIQSKIRELQTPDAGQIQL